MRPARLVAELGYPNVTTRLIARAAGVAEGTLYRHFPDIPRRLGRYLAAEKHLGRIDPRLDTDAAAITLLATLFGLAVLPHPTHSVDPHLLRTAVDLFVAVAQPQPPYGRGGTSEKSPR